MLNKRDKVKEGWTKKSSERGKKAKASVQEWEERVSEGNDYG